MVLITRFNFSFTTRFLKFIQAPYSEVILNLNLQQVAWCEGINFSQWLAITESLR